MERGERRGETRTREQSRAGEINQPGQPTGAGAGADQRIKQREKEESESVEWFVIDHIILSSFTKINRG